MIMKIKPLFVLIIIFNILITSFAMAQAKVDPETIREKCSGLQMQNWGFLFMRNILC